MSIQTAIDKNKAAISENHIENSKGKVGFKRPEWKRISLPESVFPIPSGTVEATVNSQSEKISVKPIEAGEDVTVKFDDLGHATLGAVFTDYIKAHHNSGSFIHATGKATEIPVVDMHYVLGADASTLVDSHLILAESGSEVDVVMDYYADSGRQASHYGITRILAKRGSRVRLYKLQRLDEQAHHFDQIFSVVEEGATVEVFDVQIGGCFKAISVHSILEGRHSESIAKSIYLGEKNAKLDLSFTMTHRGQKSKSEILSKGALESDSKKVFRGNLFFETGASQSTGKEEEFVMLLGDTVQSDSIPALMCSEDDVIGEHAASVGQIDYNKLFYLMSRGFSEKEAKKLVIKASFEEILSEVPFAGFKGTVSDEVDKRLALG